MIIRIIPLDSSSPLDDDEPIFLINGSFLDNLKLVLAPRFSFVVSFCKVYAMHAMFRACNMHN